MSNFFEQELRKLFEDGKVIQDPVFVGRACLGGLDAGRQVRAEFVTMGHADHYEALRLTLLDNDLGVVDTISRSGPFRTGCAWNTGSLLSCVGNRPKR